MRPKSYLKLTASASIAGLTCHMRGFFRDQSGTMSYLAIVGSLIMIVFSGVGIDMMHAELKRVKVQNTLDRAVLAAANLENQQDPQGVVEGYLAAMGLGDALTTVQIDPSLNSKRVLAAGKSSIPSDFMSLLGVNTLSSNGLAAAEHEATDLEVALVLDVSGSMASNGKIDNLRAAANDFVDILVPPDAENSVAISVVPYNATVNMGTQLSRYFALDRQHGHSNCAKFTQASFAETALTPDMPLEQVGRFDPVTSSTVPGDTPYQWCRDGDDAGILPHSSDPVEMKTHIDGLNAWGNTAIDLGVKWGTALLDPASRLATQAMEGDGLIDPQNTNRPVDYDLDTTKKYIVVMTDGQNTTQYDLPEAMKSPDSQTGVWVNTKGTETYADDDYSVRLERYSTGSVLTDYFPTYTADISNIVVYFDTTNDGTFDIAHKIEGFPDNGPKDFDTFVEGTVATLIAIDGELSDSAQLLGASIKAGNTSTYYGVNDDANGSLPDSGPILNHETIPGRTYNYSTFDVTSWSPGTEIAKYYWTRTASDPVARYQATVDGLGTNPDFIHELNYNDLYDRFGTQAVADLMFARPVSDGYIAEPVYQRMSTPYEIVAGPDTADARLDAICDSAKAQGIVIYAIGFEAPRRGLDAMRGCASSPSHFFDVDGTDLSEAFSAIARTMTNLRLTQ